MADERINDGTRHNDGKPRFDLLPWDAIGALAEHYRLGAEKYADRNWEKGLVWGRGCAASLGRHMASWYGGEDSYTEVSKKGETLTMYHDVAMVWNAMALVTFRLRDIGVDDRPRFLLDPYGKEIKKDESKVLQGREELSKLDYYLYGDPYEIKSSGT